MFEFSVKDYEFTPGRFEKWKKIAIKILKETETIENLVILVCFTTEWSKSLTTMELSAL